MINLNISWIKHKEENNFKFFKNIGMNVFEIEDLERIDDKIKELVNNNCKTIILSNKAAAFSGDIITKYKNNKNINIIIAPPNHMYK